MNSAAWLELGAGFGMGTLMSRAIGESFGDALDARTSVGIVATPQTRQEIQALLDKLDVRLANGEISEELYRRVSAKWQTRLENL